MLGEKPIHFLQALQRGKFGIGNDALIFGRRNIAERKPAVVMRWSDQSVEVDFVCTHAGYSINPGLSFSGSDRVADSSEACG